MNLDLAIRKVPDFPKPGILFYDVTSCFTNPQAFRFIVAEMERRLQSVAIDGIIAIESRGFLVGAPYATRRGLPLVLARKKGKLPGQTLQQSYALEYGESTLEIHQADLVPGKRWLIVDDLIATGGTIEAVMKMVAHQQGEVAAIFGIIGLPFLNYHQKLAPHSPITLIDYHAE